MHWGLCLASFSHGLATVAPLAGQRRLARGDASGSEGGGRIRVYGSTRRQAKSDRRSWGYSRGC